MKRLICFFVCLMIIFPQSSFAADEEKIEGVDARSCVLMEQSTGEILKSMNADEELPIASVTKIMTMLIIMEQIDSGKLKFDDMVSVSENAMSYGGSTMFLETGEQLSVNDMLKGIAVASANDGCVAMAEHIAGSEASFVELMNAKAKELGMENTHFLNTNGLDEDGHYSSARDVAIMSKELLSHKTITDYTSIWTDSLRDGKFSLANTNKLVRFYNGANGLKTGSTSKALCCLSASAIRDDMQLVAVVLGAPTSDKRFSSAKTLLDYGFANYTVIKLAEANEKVCDAAIECGTSDSIAAMIPNNITTLEKKSESGEIEREVFINKDLMAPIEKGDVIGSISFIKGNDVLKKSDIIAGEKIDRKGIISIINDIIIGFV